MFLQEVDFIFNPARRLLGIYLLFLGFCIEFGLELLVLLLERLEYFFLVLKLGLQALRYLLELLYILLHV